MDRLLQVDREELARRLLAEVQRTLGQVMDAVNAAKDGRLIVDSEREVLRLMQQLQSRVYEQAMQLRIDSSESNFSPSGGRVGPAQGQQGPLVVEPADGVGPGGFVADAVVRRSRSKRHAGRRVDR